MMEGRILQTATAELHEESQRVAQQQQEQQKDGRKRKRKSPEEIEAQTHNYVSTFLENKWEILSSPPKRKKFTPLVSQGSTNSRGAQPIDSFSKIFRIDFFEALVQVVNRNLDESYGKNQTKWNQKRVDVAEIKYFFGLLISVVNVRSKQYPSLKENFRWIMGEGNQGMGWNRFSMIWRACVPSDEEFDALEEALRKAYQDSWIPGREVVADESVWAYKPSKNVLDRLRELNIRIPLVYIPRKPHPNGLMAYQLATKSSTTGLPYILDFIVHRSFPQISAQEAAKEFADRWPFPTKMELVADSVFGSFSFLGELTKKGHDGTFSVPANASEWLWRLLARGTHDAHWNGAINSEGFVYTLIVGIDDEGKRSFHQGLSSSFVVEPPSSSSSSSSSDPTTTSPTVSLSPPTVSPTSPIVSPTSPAVSPTSPTLSQTSSTVLSTPPNSIPSIPTTTASPTSPTTASPTSPTTASPAVAPTPPPTPHLTREYLSSLKCPQLRNICRELNVRQGQRKAQTIEYILQKACPSQEEANKFETTLQAVTTMKHPAPSPISSLYKSHFNAIDLMDKKWYQFANSYQISDWRTKILFSLMDCALINAHTLHNESVRMQLTNFRESVAAKLFE